MIWQDVIMTGCSIIFSYALIPQVYRIFKLKKADQFSWQMIIPTVIALTIFNITSFTLGLYLTSAFGISTVACWILIGIGKFKYGRVK